MGKISDALDKYARERRATRAQKLTQMDLDILLAHDQGTGHLLRYDPVSGEMDARSVEVLRNKGVVQRLLDNGLIFPGGKLTPKGLQQFRELAGPEQKAAPQEPEPVEVEQTAAQEQKPAEDAGEGKKKTEPSGQLSLEEVSLLHRPPAPKTKPAPESRTEPVTEPLPDRQTKLPRPPMDEKPKKKQAQAEALAPDVNDADLTGEAQDPILSAKSPKEAVAVIPAATRSGEATAPVSPGYDEKLIDKNLVVLQKPQSFEAEQFKTLRSNILYPVSGTPPKSILVTSANPSDGKSFVASNLAVSIALHINRYVLLMDCDLRKPDIHQQFGFGDVPGLSDYLSGKTPLDTLFMRTVVNKLTVLPGGPVPLNPSELMSSESMSQLLDEVKDRYQDRMIVIDSPPPAMAAETSVLARQVDGIILVSRDRKTPRAELEQLISTMGADKILGVVVNLKDYRSMKSYGYGKYSRRYYR